MMTARKLSYDELEARLLEAEDLIGALRHHEVDVIVGEEQIAVVRLRETEEALERRVAERTTELDQARRRLCEMLDGQKRIQQQMEQSACQLRDHAELLDLTHDMIFVHDVEGRIVFWNHGAETAYGWKKEEALGQVSRQLLRTEFSEPLICVTARIIKDGGWEGQLIQTTRDGRRITVATRWALRRDLLGQPAAILETDSDITACRQAEQDVAEARQFAETVKEQLDSLAEELMRVEERQRREIAQALHDSVGQSLAFSRRELNLLRQRGPAEIRGTLEEVCGQIEDAIKRTRDLTFELSPSTLYHLGLQAALEELAGQFTEAEGFHCRVESPDAGSAWNGLNEQVRSLVYRAVRELLVNVAKHAEARNVSITLGGDEQSLEIAVQDDGRGFDPSILAGPGKGAGFGILSVRERLVRIGGAFTLESEAGRGTKITMIVPVAFGQRSGGEGLMV